MTFKKLALAAAVALVPTAGFSMEVLDDSALSDVTGQDGIEVAIQPDATNGISADIIVHDTTGYGTSTFAGAITITGFKLVTGANAITAVIDAGDTTQNGAVGTATLNIAVAIPAGTVLTTGDIGVGNSGRDDVAPGNWNANNVATVMNTMDITLGATTLNIQLGNELQDVAGAATASTSFMIALDTAIGSGGINITGFSLNDVNSSGAIGASSVRLVNANGLDATGTLDVKVGINAALAGLVLEVGQLGDATNGMDVRMTDMYLGSVGAGIVGDVSINNLNLTGTVVTISGK